VFRSTPSHALGITVSLGAVLAVAAVIEMTGGLPSQLAHFYYIPVVVSALLLPRRVSLIVALAAGAAVSPLPDLAHVAFGLDRYYADPSPWNLTASGWVVRPFAFVVINVVTSQFVLERTQRVAAAELSALRGEELTILSRVDQMILNGASESASIMQIARLVALLTGAKVAAVVVPEPDGVAQLFFGQLPDADQPSIIERRLPRGEGVSGAAIQSGESQTSSNVMDDRGYGPDMRAGAARTGYVSAAASPIKLGDQIIGALFIGYGTKHEFSRDEIATLERLSGQAAIAIEHARQRESLEELARETALALAGAIESRDSYTGHHCARLADYAGTLGQRLGLSDKKIEQMRLGAALHDIGKISVPDAILLKPGRLTEDEFAIIQRHCRTGVEICARISLGDEVLSIVSGHHERFDGTGYPEGLAGDDIPLGARIVAVVDAYDAMTTDRPYRTGMPHQQAADILRAGAGTQWDPRLVDAFLSTLERHTDRQAA